MLHSKSTRLAIISLLVSTMLFYYTNAYSRENVTAQNATVLNNAVWKHGKIGSDGKLKFVRQTPANISKVRVNGIAALFSASKKQNVMSVDDDSDTLMTKWRMNLSADYRISFLLKTDFGKRQITYTASQENKINSTKNIYTFGLGSNTSTGKWVQIKGNLANDLKLVEPENRINAISFVFIKGDGEISDFEFIAKESKTTSSNQIANSSGHTETSDTSEPQPNLENDVLAGTEPEIAAALPGRGGARRVLNLRTASAANKHAIKIDGSITEAAWHTAEVANDFRVSEQRIYPSSETEVRVLSDDKHLYFAFRCFDDNPDLVTAIKTLRDGGLGTDDAVSVSIDSYKNHRTAAIYSLNAIGTKNDQLPGSGNRKIQWKGDWRGAVKRTDYGWSAEIAIPFEILNFSPEADSFGINFSRYQHRTQEKSYWVKPTTEKQINPLGYLAGFTLPRTKTSRVWTLMPYFVAGKNTINRDGQAKDHSVHGGVTIRYEPLNNLTGLMELLPDFSQVESQISDIDFSYNEKEVDDTRTFFQEGYSNFETDSEYFYSPRIPDFDVGVKTFMQNDRNVLGLLATGSDDGRRDFHARYRRNLPGNAGLTLSAVRGDQEESSAALFAAGIDKKFNSGIFFDVKNAWSQNDSGGSEGTATSRKLLLGLSKSLWEIGFNHDQYTADYNPPTALLNSDLPGTRSNGVYASVYKEGHGIIKEINSDVTYTKRNTLAGEEQSDGVYLSASFEVSGTTRLQFAYSDFDYRPLTDTPGVFQDTANNDRFWSTNFDFNIYSSRFGYGGFAADGTLGGGEYRYLSAYVWFNPTNSTNLKISTEDLTSFGRFKQTTVSGGWDFSSNDGVIARLSKGDSFEQLRLAYRRKVSSGIDVFLSFQKQTEVKDEYTGKFVWTF